MARSRTQAQLPVPKLPIWKQVGKFFHADRKDLEYAIEAAGVPVGLIKMRMGHGYHHLIDALNGARLDCWAVGFLEMGIRLPDEKERHDYRQFWNEVAP